MVSKCTHSSTKYILHHTYRQYICLSSTEEAACNMENWRAQTDISDIIEAIDGLAEPTSLSRSQTLKEMYTSIEGISTASMFKVSSIHIVLTFMELAVVDFKKRFIGIDVG